MKKEGYNCKKPHLIKQKAFTLAEILITLAIIGVVAALTIPSLIVNYQKKQIATKLKKVYSSISNATNLAINEHGPISEWDISDTKSFDHSINVEFMETYILPYLKVLKKCSENNSECTKLPRKDLKNTSNNIYKNPSGEPVADAILTDGTLIWIYVYNSQAGLIFDINGDKAPNIWGKDTFQIQYSKNYKLANQFGMAGKTYTKNILITHAGEGCNKTANNVAGRYCGALIVQNNWQIPTKEEYIQWGGNAVDYPW